MQIPLRNHRTWGWLAVVICLSGGLTAVAYQSGQEKPGKPKVNPEETALRESGKAFVEAFNKGDVKALAAQWTEGGEFRNENGVVVKGRPALEKSYETWLGVHQKPAVSIRIDSIRFLSKDAAWVEGILEFKGNPQSPTEVSRFRTLRVREDGQWLIAESTEIGAGEASLGELSWLLGTWKATGKDQEAEISVTPWLGQGYFKADFKIRRKGEPMIEGTQIVGKDLRNGGLRSWIFDLKGATAEGVWVHDGHKWDLEIDGFTPSGLPISSVQIFSPIDKNNFLWQAIERNVDGQRFPDTLPLKLQRVK